MPGEHNLLNAAAVFLAARIAGFSATETAGALAEFEGTARRFETKGEVGGVRVIDDYAHHPTEVAALMRQSREAAGKGRVLVVFQPHLYSRTKNFCVPFLLRLLTWQIGQLFCDIYGAREDPLPGVTSRIITDKMQRGSYVADKDEAARLIANEAHGSDLILTVGAGDITKATTVVLAVLKQRFSQ